MVNSKFFLLSQIQFRFLSLSGFIHVPSSYGENNTLLDRSLEEAYENMDDDEIFAAIQQKHLKDSTVTIVLVGNETANRKWIDWEIYASLKPYGQRSRNGLLGIIPPTADEIPARLQITLIPDMRL